MRVKEAEAQADAKITAARTEAEGIIAEAHRTAKKIGEDCAAKCAAERAEIISAATAASGESYKNALEECRCAAAEKARGVEDKFERYAAEIVERIVK